VALAALAGAVYLWLASDGTFRFARSTYPHHVLIADAWLHGQLHARPEALKEAGREALLDWTVIEGRRYGYWGPAPAVLLLPYVAVKGLAASDRLAGALVGALTVLLIYLVLRELARLGAADITAPVAAAVAVLFAFGTVHLYVAPAGWVWMLSQVVAAFFFTLAVWAVLRCDLSWWWAAAAGAAFGASLLSRYSEAFAGLFFPIALIAAARAPGAGWRPRLARLGTAFAVPVLLAAQAALAYNRARFGHALETGVARQAETGGHPRFREDYRRYGAFHPHFVPKNAYYYFLNPKLRRHPKSGERTFDPEGNSLFLVTPALLYALRPPRRRHWAIAAARAGCAACLAMLLLYFGTGYYGFGNRYLLDLLPLAMVLVAAGLRGRLAPLALAAIGLSVAVNAWGAWRFLHEAPW